MFPVGCFFFLLSWMLDCLVISFFCFSMLVSSRVPLFIIRPGTGPCFFHCIFSSDLMNNYLVNKTESYIRKKERRNKTNGSRVLIKRKKKEGEGKKKRNSSEVVCLFLSFSLTLFFFLLASLLSLLLYCFHSSCSLLFCVCISSFAYATLDLSLIHI